MGQATDDKAMAARDNMAQLEKDAIIKRQLRFQELLIQISTKYINSDLVDIDKLINDSLKQIGVFVEADRSYIFSYDFSTNTTSNTYEWCADGVTPEIGNLQNVPIDFIPQWLEAHQKGLPFYVENVGSLPLDGEHGLRAILEPQGVKSLITIPKIKNNQLIGFIGFDSVQKLNTYTEHEKDILFVYASMLINVIQRKENEERLQEQERKKEELLAHLSKQNEELNEYAHVVSHDLKSPLTNVHTLVNWYMEERKDSLTQEDRESLDLVLFNVEKMDLLIKGILEYSTIDRLEEANHQIDLNVLLMELWQTISIPDHMTITVQESLPSIYGNPWRFKQLFQNLIVNAIVYNDKEQGLVEVGYMEKEQYYVFFVKDNGKGIKKSYHDRIFKVFGKLESTSSSSGVGLSIVRKIVRYYQGDIWLESQEGVGTTFYFTLPKQQA
ncbi:Two-component sensor histidine kinase [Croceitalea dokdonensis DOKDO 023]|uniref:histidine kinase n=1 Tax=Croceitalea dokdonensis DOKDO 023 TaxID=1300341 RepID=A0A0N8H3N2_9FLAO|nr:ATP-binding protein [Croceitalea dokdonensis]KPM31044.1 Two-component sensor histidine kinase [Croceitalea dokdonensis DOKDO 023]